MIYLIDAFGRPTGKTLDRTMDFYKATPLIPRYVTDVPPLPPKDGFDVVFNGHAWEYFKHETNESLSPVIEE